MNLLRGFSKNHFIPKYSFQTRPVARIQTCYLPKLHEHKFDSHLPYTNHVNKFTMLFAGVLNSRTNSFTPGEHDTNQQMTQATTSKSQKGRSSQHPKSGPTKPRDNISRRRSYKLEHIKFFLLVFLNVQNMFVNNFGSLQGSKQQIQARIRYHQHNRGCGQHFSLFLTHLETF